MQHKLQQLEEGAHERPAP